MGKKSSKPRSHKDHIIEGIAPAREVHLVGGPSGGGKTTWLLKLMRQWERGEDIFGHKSSGGKFVYISGDRSIDGMKRTLERVGEDPDAFPLYVIPATLSSASGTMILSNAISKHPDADVFVFEGLQSFVPDGKSNDYRVVAKFLKELAEHCQKHNVTLIGVVHSPKMKPDAIYKSPRERVMGSVAWGAYADMICLIEPCKPEKTSTVATRNLWILPRNGKDEHYILDWKDGMLVPVAGGTAATTTSLDNFTKLIAYLATVPELGTGERAFRTMDALEGTGLDRNAFNWEIKKALDQGIVERDEHGHYRVRRLPTASA